MSKSISYRMATIADTCEIRDLFIKYFYPFEPFNVGWINDDPVPEDIEATLKVIHENMSFVAVDDNTNRIIGACISGIDTPNVIESMIEQSKSATCKKWSDYLKLFVRLNSESKIFERFDVQEVFHINSLVVDPNYSNNSIGTNLMDKCLQLGTSLGYKVSSVNCSSFYTEKIAQKLNMQCISSVAMDSVLDDDGNRLIYSSEPHTHINTYAKVLNFSSRS